MTETSNDGEVFIPKASQLNDKVDMVIPEASVVNVMTPMELADVEQVVGAATLKGEVQPNEFRDAWAAILFLLQFVGVMGVAIAYFPYIGQSDQNSTSTVSGNEVNDDLAEGNAGTSGVPDSLGVMFLLCLVLSYAMAGFTTMGALSLMMRYPELIVKISFFFFPFVWVAIALLFMLTGDDVSIVFISLAAAISFLSLCFWFFYKKHVPFAAANLRCALTALRLNSATYALSWVISIVSFVTMVVFVIAIAGVQSKSDSEGQVLCSKLYNDDSVVYATGQMCDTNPPNPVFMIGLLFAFYWTQQVVQNIMHVTTAGVVGSWWFTAMGDPSCCSPTVTSSLSRSLTYSFGSICFGSLLVAIFRTLEQLAKSSRNNGRGGSLIGCLVQCLFHCLREFMEYFNSWAFVYVGIYGYPFIEAGKNVLTLFRQRGWTTLIADNLVFRALLLCNLGIGSVCGLVTSIVCKFVIAPTLTEGQDFPLSVYFFVGFTIGLLIANVALFPVESAVRTVIVCFAESPAEFDEHHPELSEMMKAGWSEAYPTIAGVWA